MHWHDWLTWLNFYFLYQRYFFIIRNHNILFETVIQFRLGSDFHAWYVLIRDPFFWVEFAPWHFRVFYLTLFVFTSSPVWALLKVIILRGIKWSLCSLSDLVHNGVKFFFKSHLQYKKKKSIATVIYSLASDTLYLFIILCGIKWSLCSLLFPI